MSKTAKIFGYTIVAAITFFTFFYGMRALAPTEAPTQVATASAPTRTIAAVPVTSEPIEVGILELGSICNLDPGGQEGKGSWDCYKGTLTGLPRQCYRLEGKATIKQHGTVVHYATVTKDLNICFRKVPKNFNEVVHTLTVNQTITAVEVNTRLNGVEQFGFAPGRWRVVDLAAAYTQ